MSILVLFELGGLYSDLLWQSELSVTPARIEKRTAYIHIYHHRAQDTDCIVRDALYDSSAQIFDRLLFSLVYTTILN